MTVHIYALALVVPLATSIAAASALAKEPGIPRGQKTFERLDKDNNGKLELSELQPASVRRFMKLDKDGDGKVAVGEIEDWLRAKMQRRRDRIMARMDANKDGAVSRAELSDYVGAQFKRADFDTDGGVTHTEAKAYHVAKRKKYWAGRKKARAQN